VRLPFILTPVPLYPSVEECEVNRQDGEYHGEDQRD